MINPKCKKIADEMTWDHNEGKVSPFILPFIFMIKETGATLAFRYWLIHKFLLAGWVPPHIMAELEQEISEAKFKLTQFEDLKDENVRLRQETDQIRNSMAQMTEWHNKINDFLKAKEAKTL